jgi:hypothetical protein
MGEAQAGQASRGVRLITPPVDALLLGRAVVSQAVRFHDEPEVGPVEVDAIAVDPLLGER